MLPGNHVASLQSYFQPATWPGIGMSDLANKRILSINSNPLQEVVSNVTLQSVWQMVKELSWGWGFFRAHFILVYQGVTQNIKMVNPGLGHELRSSLSYLELKGQDPWREDTTNQHFKGEKAQSTLGWSTKPQTSGVIIQKEGFGAHWAPEPPASTPTSPNWSLKLGISKSTLTTLILQRKFSSRQAGGGVSYKTRVKRLIFFICLF